MVRVLHGDSRLRACLLVFHFLELRVENIILCSAASICSLRATLSTLTRVCLSVGLLSQSTCCFRQRSGLLVDDVLVVIPKHALEIGDGRFDLCTIARLHFLAQILQRLLGLMD